MIFDGHSDIFTDITIKRLQGEIQVLKNHHLPRLQKGGFEGGCFVIWVDPPYDYDHVKRMTQILEAISAEMVECTTQYGRSGKSKNKWQVLYFTGGRRFDINRRRC